MARIEVIPPGGSGSFEEADRLASGEPAQAGGPRHKPAQSAGRRDISGVSPMGRIVAAGAGALALAGTLVFGLMMMLLAAAVGLGVWFFALLVRMFGLGGGPGRGAGTSNMQIVVRRWPGE